MIGLPTIDFNVDTHLLFYIDFRLQMTTFCVHWYLCGTAYRNVSRWQTLHVLKKCPIKHPQQVCETHPHTHPVMIGMAWNKQARVFPVFDLSVEHTLLPFSLIFARVSLSLQTRHSISSHTYPVCVEQMRGPSVIFVLFVSTVSHNLVYTLRLL